MNIYISDETGEIEKLYKKDMHFIVTAILVKLHLPDATEISLLFTDDVTMRSYNRQYRNLDKTTDVLSFPQGFDADNKILGDVLISVDTALRQAKMHDISVESEIERLLVHGILHLLGYDHKKKKERKIMREQENYLIDYINSLK